MRLSKNILWVLISQLIINMDATAAYSKAGASEKDVKWICAEDGSGDCYPELFEASEEWSEIKEGQIIPAGLEVRLSLENDQREARLLPESEKQQTKGKSSGQGAMRQAKSNDLAIVNTGTSFDGAAEFVGGLFKSNRAMVNLEYNEVLEHLQTLDDWASEEEYGVKIAKTLLQPLLHLTGLYDDKGKSYGLTFRQLNSVKDLSYRILNAAFRNNEVAQDELLRHTKDASGFLTKLVNHDDNNLVTKSRLGLLGSVLSNGRFESAFAASGLERDLLQLFSITNDSAIKNRVVTILEDRRSLSKREDEDVSEKPINERFARLLESELMSSSLRNDIVARDLLQTLKNLKQSKTNAIKVSSRFLDWLDRELNKEKEHQRVKRDDSNNDEDSYLEELISLRHQVFGNRLGSRRDYEY